MTLKFCDGPCERELPATLDYFYPNRHGRPSNLCRTCRRWKMRTQARWRYHHRREDRATRRAARRAYYWSHREQERIHRRDRWWRRKLKEAA